MQITKDNINKLLFKAGYCSNDTIDYALMVSMISGKPLLIEGAPGVGKSALPKAISDATGCRFIRCQMYEGLTDDKIMYDYDYERQLLTLQAIQGAIDREFGHEDINDMIHDIANKLDFYGPDFMIRRPVLDAITSKERVVLLFDEIDKAPEEIEYMLYEFLEDYSISIPQYGKISCPEKTRPLVFLTSNSYRELSGALKRRCAYLYIDAKSEKEMADILLARTNCDKKLAETVARLLVQARRLDLHNVPSVAEGIDWTNVLISQIDHLDQSFVLGSLAMLVKDERDMPALREMINYYGQELWA